MEKIVVASANKAKIKEIQDIFTGYSVITMKEAGFEGDIEENGLTFEENAIINARAVSEKLGCIALADDSGLCINALDGAPGIYSARFCGRHGDDDANNKLLLKKLADKNDRSGYFESAVAICFPNGKTITASGKTYGVILYKEEGENGFGYDPLFFSTEINKCFGVATAQEKNAISHRGRALRALSEKLRAENL